MSLITSIPKDPLVQLDHWLKEAADKGLAEPTAMTLATASKDGAPAARMVLCKAIEDGGVTFFTNYDSRKATDLAANPRAALVFFWQPLQRQVRLEGKILKTDRAVSEAYFATRPRGSQIGAWASKQSSLLSSYDDLSNEFARLDAQYAGKSVPCPPHWGGYRLTPDSCEFWQGKDSRLHDRVLFVRTGSGWQLKQLAP